MPVALVLILAAYLVGSLSSAILTTRAMGLPDPRTQGSGNPGATNVLRYGGRGAAAVTLTGDVLKGYLPVAMGDWLGVSAGVLGATAVAAFLGHLFPVYFGFRGGKGVATALGVLLALAWPVALGAALTWLAVAVLTRYSSLAALSAAGVVPLLTVWFTGEGSWVAATGVMAALLFWRHRANIRRLVAGTESRIGGGGRAPGDGPAAGEHAPE
jgi:glycerol-3-phosphate acyltransferase PlsY